MLHHSVPEWTKKDALFLFFSLHLLGLSLPPNAAPPRQLPPRGTDPVVHQTIGHSRKRYQTVRWLFCAKSNLATIHFRRAGRVALSLVSRLFFCRVTVSSMGLEARYSTSMIRGCQGDVPQCIGLIPTIEGRATPDHKPFEAFDGPTKPKL